MGNLATNSSDQNEQNTVLKINIDLQKPLLDELKQLNKWSLQQIRQIFSSFRKRKGSPILTRSEFQRFIRLSRLTSFFIFDKMVKFSTINVFQIVSVLTLMSYSSTNHKVQFLFNAFDLEGNKNLSFKQLILLFTSLIRGLCIVTGQPMPDIFQLQKYAQTLFSRADLNNDQNLQVGEVLGWFQSHSDGSNLFNKYEPQFLGKQSYHVFNHFPGYTPLQIQTIFIRINKVYFNQELDDQDYKILSPIKLHQSQNSTPLYKQNIFHQQITNNKLKISTQYAGFKKYSESTYQNSSILSQKRVLGNISLNLNGNQSIIYNQILKPNLKNHKNSNNIKKNLSSKLPSLHLSTNKCYLKQNNNSLHNSKIPKKVFNNIIIIKGRTITKKQIFELRQYFDKISNGKKIISIQDFLDSFNQQKYNHMKSVAASLFNFLDKKQTGKVSFTQFVTKLYPDLTKQHLLTINNWSQQYNISFNLDKKIKGNRQQQQHKKRTLPKSCLNRYKQLYDLFDYNHKGYISYEDLKRVLGDVSTDKQLMETFQDCDKDKDGKISIVEFSHIILPQDLEIQGLM